MGALSWVNGTSVTRSTTTPVSSVDLTTPSGLDDDDALILLLSIQGTADLTPPAGWTILDDETLTTPSYGDRRLFVVRKDTVTWMDSSEPFTWTFSTNSNYAGTYFAVRDWDGPVRVRALQFHSQTNVNLIGTDMTFEPLVATRDGSIIVLAAMACAVVVAASQNYDKGSELSGFSIWHSAYTYNFLTACYGTVDTGQGNDPAGWMYTPASGAGNGYVTVAILLEGASVEEAIDETVILGSHVTPGNMVEATAADTLTLSHGLSGIMGDGTMHEDDVSDFLFVDAVTGTGGETIDGAASASHLIDMTGAVVGYPSFADDAFTVGNHDTIIPSDSLAGGTTIWGAKADFGIKTADTLIGGDAIVVHPRWGYVQRDTIHVGDTRVPMMRYRRALADGVRVAYALYQARPVQATDALTVAASPRAVVALRIIEALQVGEAPTGAGRYGLALLQTLTVRDSLARFFGAEALETVTLAEAVQPGYRGHVTLPDTIALSETLGHTLILRVTVAEGVEIAPDMLLRMLYRPSLTDGVVFDALYVQPNGAITTWAVNTRTNAVTEYTGYEFNSFARVGLRYLAAASDGLYVLDGATDDGDAIIANIKTGLAQFAGSRFSAIKGIYLGIRSSGEFALKVIDGAGVVRVYKVLVDGRRTAKVQIGKGIRTRYMAFELVSTGQDFDMDTIEIVPLLETRRV